MSHASHESELRRLLTYEVEQRNNYYPSPLGPLTQRECDRIAKATQLARTVALNRQSNQQLRSRNGLHSISLLPASR